MNTTTAPSTERSRLRSNQLTRWQRFASKFPLLLIIVSIFFLSVTYLAVTIGLDYRNFRISSHRHFHDFGLPGWSIRERIVEVLLLWWVVAFGASVGSFLNVVVYRMPLGMSLSAKSSHCVWCKAKIRSSDNLPIIGWIRLRGRCRKCRLPISGRYPLVEAITGTLGLVAFVAMVQVKNFGLGPFEDLPVSWHYWLMYSAPVGQLVLYFFYFWVLAFLVSVAWMDWDGKALPWKLFLTSCLAAILVPAGVRLLAQPYFQMQLMSSFDIRFASDWAVDWLDEISVLNTIGEVGSRWRTSAIVLVYQLLGGLCGLLTATGLWIVFYSAFPVSEPTSIEAVDSLTNSSVEPAADSHSGSGADSWQSGLMIFFVVGLFMGPVYVVLLGAAHFMISILLTPILMNGRLSPLRHRWFFLPYSFILAIFFWRFFESLLS